MLQNLPDPIDALDPDRLAWPLLPGLQMLLRACDYAIDLQSDVWQFAVPLSQLKESGLTQLDAQWLVAKGWLVSAKETTVPSDTLRVFRKVDRLHDAADVAMILTPAGREAVQGLFERHPSDKGENAGASLPARAVRTSKPRWDVERRELSFKGKLVKRFRVPAVNQECILAAFEEEGWPSRIDDPLPPKDGLNAPVRLYATLKSLNRSQANRLLWFHGNGNGLVVLWEARSGSRK